MNEQVFRKKSLDKVKSPESLNDYVRVSNPGVWLILAGVIALLLGACVWGVFGHVDTTVKSSVAVANGNAVCSVSLDEGTKIKQGMTVKIDDKEGTVSGIIPDGEKGTCRVDIKTDIPDGVYSAEIIIESVKPISFVLN